MTPGRWERVAVVGCSGSGKSTLAARLASELECEHTRLDDLAFEPGWRLRQLDAVRADVSEIAETDRWVLDGNYRYLRPVVWSRATDLVWLDLPMATSFRRVLVRTLCRSLTGQRVCGGNRETLWKAFATRDSILRWVLASHADLRRTIAEDITKPEYAHLAVHRVARPCDANHLTPR